MTFWQPFWILAAILKFKENNFHKYGFPDIMNIHLDSIYCFLRLLQTKICKFPEFGGHLGKMADRKKCSTFGVWLQTDLDSAAQNLMETIIKSLYMSQNKVQLRNAWIICMCLHAMENIFPVINLTLSVITILRIDKYIHCIIIYRWQK